MVTHRFILCVVHNCILFFVVQVSLGCVFIFRSIRRHTHLAACALSRAVRFSNVHSNFVCIGGWSCIRLCGLIYKCRWFPGRKERTNYCLWWLSMFWCLYEWQQPEHHGAVWTGGLISELLLAGITAPAGSGCRTFLVWRQTGIKCAHFSQYKLTQKTFWKSEKVAKKVGKDLRKPH